MTLIANDIKLTLPFNRYDGQRVSEWLEQSGRTPIHVMLMEFDATAFSYENIRHALISIVLDGNSPSHEIINTAIKAQADIAKIWTGRDINLHLITSHWSQDEPFMSASFWSDPNTWGDRTVSIWFEFGPGGNSEKMYAAFLVEGTWRVLEFSRLVTY